VKAGFDPRSSVRTRPYSPLRRPVSATSSRWNHRTAKQNCPSSRKCSSESPSQPEREPATPLRRLARNHEMTPQVPNPAVGGGGEVGAARAANGRTVLEQKTTARQLRFPGSLGRTRRRAATIAAIRIARPPVVDGAVGARPAMLKLSPKVAPGAPKAVEMTDLVAKSLVVTSVVKGLVVMGLAVEGLAVMGGGRATQGETIGAMGAAGMAPRAVPRATTPR